MPKFIFDSELIGKAFAIAKIVKPIITKFSMKVIGEKLVIFSYDRRRWTRSSVQAKETKDNSPDYDSGEFFISSDRQTLIHTDLETVTLSITDKAIALKTEGNGQSRNATLQRRSHDSKLAKIADLPAINMTHVVNANHLAELLHQVSCSALVKETKTDEARKYNQVHFFAESSCAYSNARGFMTLSTLSGLNLDLSIVSDDVPLMKAFCVRLGDSDVVIQQNDSHLWISDVDQNNILYLSRIATKKPLLPVIDSSGFSMEIQIDRQKFSKAMQWAGMTIDGTQRATLRAKSSDSVMEVFHGKDEIAKFPISFIKGTELNSDFSYKILSTVSNYLGGDNLTLKYGHSTSPHLLEVSETSDSPVKSRHFLQSMITR